MRPRFTAAFALFAVVAISACGGHSTLVPSSGIAPTNTSASESVPLTPFSIALLRAPKIRLCPDAGAGRFECYGIVSDLRLDLRPNAGCSHQPGCYGPSDLQSAYGIKNASKGGKGMTVAVVDAFGYPAVQKDLAAYRSHFHLPSCGKGCFKVVGEYGGKPPKATDPGWDGEQALDVDMVSALCPKCHIVLVESNTDENTDLINGEQTAIKLANVVSNSWGGPEYASTFDPFDSHNGVVITASSGDQGAGSEFRGSTVSAQEPCAFQGVICVGGTSLVLNKGRRVSEVVWNDLTQNKCQSGPCATGSGCSSLVQKPVWQNDTGCPGRSETDISADADPNTGVVVRYNNSWVSAGGTSASSPMIGAMYALAGNAKTANGALLWSKGGSSAFYAITSGTDESKAAHTYVCSKAILYICKAGTGMNGVYSGPTGWGTPHGLSAL